jgi:hypothetical protein
MKRKSSKEVFPLPPRYPTCKNASLGVEKRDELDYDSIPKKSLLDDPSEVRDDSTAASSLASTVHESGLLVKAGTSWLIPQPMAESRVLYDDDARVESVNLETEINRVVDGEFPNSPNFDLVFGANSSTTPLLADYAADATLGLNLDTVTRGGVERISNSPKHEIAETESSTEIRWDSKLSNSPQSDITETESLTTSWPVRNIDELRARFASDGYLLLRDFLPRTCVEEARRGILVHLRELGYLDQTVDVCRLCCFA